MKVVEIIPLAKKKIIQRKISEQWVIETVRKPEQIVEGYVGDSWHIGDPQNKPSKDFYERYTKKLPKNALWLPPI